MMDISFAQRASEGELGELSGTLADASEWYDRDRCGAGEGNSGARCCRIGLISSPSLGTLV